MTNEDAILPDDFQETPSQVEETPGETQVAEEVTTQVEDTKPTEGTTESTEPIVQDTPKLKIKYNSEEREIPLDEAAVLAQKGLNYDKAVERAKQEARDAYIAEQGYTWNGKSVTTEAEYNQARMEQDLINKYKDKELPDEVIQELLESRRDREERKTEKKASEEKAKEEAAKAERDADYLEFFKYFKKVNGREFDAEKDKIPPTVWEAHQKGESLRYTYVEWHNNELQNQLKVTKQNEENIKRAPDGSVTAHGSTEVAAVDDFMKGFNSI